MFKFFLLIEFQKCLKHFERYMSIIHVFRLHRNLPFRMISTISSNFNNNPIVRVNTVVKKNVMDWVVELIFFN